MRMVHSPARSKLWTLAMALTPSVASANHPPQQDNNPP
jgi:hypothetical protein